MSPLMQLRLEKLPQPAQFDNCLDHFLWIDGTPTPLNGSRCELQLNQGQHVITIGVKRPAREKRLVMKLEVPNGQPHAQWSVTE